MRGDRENFLSLPLLATGFSFPNAARRIVKAVGNPELARNRAGSVVSTGEGGGEKRMSRVFELEGKRGEGTRETRGRRVGGKKGEEYRSLSPASAFVWHSNIYFVSFRFTSHVSFRVLSNATQTSVSNVSLCCLYLYPRFVYQVQGWRQKIHRGRFSFLSRVM